MKHGLGRGIMALLDDQEGTGEDANRTDVIDINKIMPNRYQPRKLFNENSLKELSDSIRDKGILQPVIVTELGDGRYELVAGERRWRAAKLAGLMEIPALIKDFSDEDKLEISLIENIQREDLNPVEKAEAFKEIIERLNISQDDLAKKIGKDRTSVSNTLRLLKLPEFVKNRIVSGEITEGHARAILSLDDIDCIIELTKSVIEKGLSVRETEAVVRNFSKNKVPAKPKKDRRHYPEIADIQERMIKVMRAKVEIKGTLSKGKIEIYYFSREDLQNIYGFISGRGD
jgi:ParB family chromosome partitioning protein